MLVYIKAMLSKREVCADISKHMIHHLEPDHLYAKEIGHGFNVDSMQAFAVAASVTITDI